MMVTRASLLIAIVGAVACGHEHDPCASHSHDPMCLVCTGAEDPIPSTVAGDGGALSVAIISADPTPLVVGNHTLVVRVEDGAGTALAGVTFVEVEPFYPPGGHGTPIVPTVTETTPGEYTIAEVNFVHPGPWELRFDVTHGTTTDHAVFTLCIEDE